MAKFYYTYVLRSFKDGNLYIGWTDDLKRRIKEHNKGRTYATRLRKPFKLVYFEACLTKDGAIKRERALKTGFGRKYLKSRIYIPR